MSVIKVKILKGFTILANAVLENPRLSFKAKGLWAYCMSRPDDWEFHVEHLATVSKEKKRAIYAALEELILEGLVIKSQANKKKGERKGQEGFAPVEYTIYPLPQAVPEEIKKKIAQRRFARAQKSTLIRTDLNKKGTPPLPPHSPSARSESSSSSSRPRADDDWIKKRLKKLMGKKEPSRDELKASLKKLKAQNDWREAQDQEKIRNPVKWLETDILCARAVAQVDDDEPKWGKGVPEDLDENGINRNVKVYLPEGFE